MTSVGEDQIASLAEITEDCSRRVALSPDPPRHRKPHSSLAGEPTDPESSSVFLTNCGASPRFAPTACPWPATSVRTIRENKPGEADRRVVTSPPSVAGGNGLEWTQPMNPGTSTMSFPHQTSEQANLWIGIRSEPGPHEFSNQHPD
jgi:hypothetical protein